MCVYVHQLKRHFKEGQVSDPLESWSAPIPRLAFPRLILPPLPCYLTTCHSSWAPTPKCGSPQLIICKPSKQDRSTPKAKQISWCQTPNLVRENDTLEFRGQIGQKTSGPQTLKTKEETETKEENTNSVKNNSEMST